MSIQEVEKLLKKAIAKINGLEAEHTKTVQKLEKRIGYLEEMISAQKIMLSDSIKYLNSVDPDKKKEKEA